MVRWLATALVALCVAAGVWLESLQIVAWRERAAGDDAYYAGDLEGALSHYELARRALPRDPRSHIDLADSLLSAVEWRVSMGQDVAAIQPWVDRCTRNYLNAIRMAPPNAWAYHGLASLVGHMGRARTLSAGLDLSSVSTDLLANLGPEARFEEAALAKAVQIEPRNYYYRDFLGEFYLRNGFTDRALAHIQAAVRLQPVIGRHYYLSDLVQVSPEVLEAVERGIQQALESPQTEVSREQIHRFLAEVYLRMERYQDARENFEAAATYSPTPHLLDVQIGRMLAAEGDTGGALAAYLRSTEREPGYFRSWMLYGQTLATVGRHDEAVEALRTARGIQPTEYQPGWLLACELETRGELDEAATVLETLLWGHPDKNEPYLKLIDIYQRSSRVSDAVRVARDLALRYPEESVYQQQLQQLVSERERE